MNREKQFEDFVNFNFAELVQIKFKSGRQPRNATDYYYLPKNNTIYSYYFGDNPGRWQANPKIDISGIKSPLALNPEPKAAILKSKSSNERLILDLQLKLAESERKLIEAQIELEKIRKK